MKRSSIIVWTTLIVVFLIVIKIYCALYGNPYTLFMGENKLKNYLVNCKRYKEKNISDKDESMHINSISAEIKISKKSISTIQKVYGKLTVLKDYTVVIFHDKPNVEYYYSINDSSDEYRQMFTKRYLKN